MSHGGNIYALLRKGFRYEDIIDFSASLNPLGMPESVLTALKEGFRLLVHYPDPEQFNLRRNLSIYHEINPETIIPGNGSTELIYLTVRTLRPERVLLLSPTFSEYERASKCTGSSIMVYELKEENNFDLDPDDFISFFTRHHSSQPFDMIFICNPNNPTGRLIKKEDLLKIAEACCKREIYLIVDEAFVDFVPEESIIKYVSENPFLIVLRSMTKFYGLAGLRLGYGVFHLRLVERILFFREPWTVNTLAQMAGTVALTDSEFRKKTLLTIGQWKRLLEEFFRRLGIFFISSSVNFYLFRYKRAIKSLFEDQGILIRDCSDFRGLEPATREQSNLAWFRIAVRRPEEMERFFEVVAKVQ